MKRASKAKDFFSIFVKTMNLHLKPGGLKNFTWCISRCKSTLFVANTC